ncbi:MAG: GntR family transcriptional regulator [Lachnospiraceae bacterium]|nr:GntR family transcriptional regulator [Lachnospiraceae bacterium]
MSWKLDSDRPIYTQIVERLQIQIVAGEFAPGSRLKSVRDMAMEAGVNPNTMQRAFTELERLGLVTTNRSTGRQVTEETEMIQKTRNELAQTQVRDFLSRMGELGFEKKEVVSLLNAESKNAESKTIEIKEETEND